MGRTSLNVGLECGKYKIRTSHRSESKKEPPDCHIRRERQNRRVEEKKPARPKAAPSRGGQGTS